MTPSSPQRLSPDRARAILHARFSTAGLELQTGYPFRADDFEQTLDGYDPKRRTGYTYVDGDQTGASRSSEETLARLAAADKAHILLIYSDDMPNLDALERRIDAFFRHLQRRR